MHLQYFPESAVGVFLCCFGLYEKIIDSILHFFKDVKTNFKFLLPLAIGTIIGIFIFGNILKIAFDKFYMETSFVFIGLILGSLNLILKQANVKKITLAHILCTFVTLSFSIYLVALEKNLDITSYISSNSYLILAGALMSAGIVIPGVSKTVILMMLGLYQTYLSAISTMDFSILLPIGIGLLIGGTVFLFLINLLFKFAKSYTYFGIIGFVLGSIFVIYPGFTFDIHGIISILLLVISFIIGFMLSNLQKNSS